MAADAPRPRVVEEVAARGRDSGEPHLRSAAAVSGYAIHATDGTLGHVEDYLIDEESWTIRYLVVDPQSWWPGQHVIVSTEWIRGVSWDDSAVTVDLTKEAVRSAPPYDPTSAVPREYESGLFRHHGCMPYWEVLSALMRGMSLPVASALWPAAIGSAAVVTSLTWDRRRRRGVAVGSSANCRGRTGRPRR